MRIKHYGLGLILLISLTTACSSEKSPAPAKEIQIVRSNPAAVPEGTVRYCWEEPMVDYQKIDAGLDIDGHYYYPGHTAVREVRMGRWRPCKKQRSVAEKRSERRK